MIFSYLALGDSYTIGEQVPIADSFPYQVVQGLRKRGIAVYAPEIIAKTGWTTEELAEGIQKTSFIDKYEIVSLLIGVNNQYRGKSVIEFETGFGDLLQQAIRYSGNRPGRVFVISIPDWGLTPFAAAKDPVVISAEIDAYNEVCRTSSEKAGVTYLDITASQRNDVKDHSFLAGDLLHPSGKEYAKWAEKLSGIIFDRLNASS